MVRTCAMFLLISVSWNATATRQAFGQSEDETAIRNAVKSYAESFNKADAGGVAAHWSEQGEFITPAGLHLKGREAIQQEFAAYFEETKDAKVEIAEPTIEFLSPHVARETGTATVLVPDGQPHVTDYEAIHVKTGDAWKMDSVHEVEPEVVPSNYHRLSELEWMIGQWVDADEEGVVETRCEWTKNQNFILRSFQVAIADRIELEGTQIIGWDPIRQAIRSWVFDSDGGFGVGVWSREGNQWTVRSLHVTQAGEQASAINIMTYVDGDKFTFKSVGREVNGEVQPNIDEVTVVRKR